MDNFGEKTLPTIQIPDSALLWAQLITWGHNISKSPPQKASWKLQKKKPALMLFFGCLERKRRLQFWVFIFHLKKNPPSCPGPRTAPGGCQLGWSLDKMHYCCDTQHRGDADFFSLFGGIDFWRGSFHWCITMGMNKVYIYIHIGTCNSLYSCVSKSSWGRNYMNLWNTFTLKWDFGGV